MYAQTRFPPVGPPPAQPGHRPGDLTLLCQRLLDALPVTDSAAWMINDALRAVSFAALTWLAYLLTPFDWLRGKWLLAAALAWLGPTIVERIKADVSAPQPAAGKRQEKSE